MKPINIRNVEVKQYIKPLREGGSLPAIVKGDDGFLYVLKFRGAGQGKKALIAEFIGGELARKLGLNVPEIVFMNLDDSFSKTEPDEEIQDLLKFSVGLNIGLHYLSGAITYDPLVSKVDSLTASLVVLLDSLISNIDRTCKNTNLLMWHNELWLIDHGSSFYFHHNWKTWERHLTQSFPAIKDHVFIDRAKNLDQAEAKIMTALTPSTLQEIVNHIPDDWLVDKGDSLSPNKMRTAYVSFIQSRIDKIATLRKEVEDEQ
ncbi:aminotransferase class I and II [Flavobacteriaceae bacterium F08102]|nr:aminotransferase class I and II [Flavobacteriaceae bacterium F08102]